MAANSHSLSLASASSQYATIADASQTGLNFGTGAFAIRCWIKRASIGASMGIVNKRDADATGYGFLFNANNTITAYTLAASAADTATSVGTITDTTTWHFLSFIRNGTTLRLAIDGTEDGTGTDNGKNVSSTANFHVGAFRSTADVFLNSLIDEVGVFNTVQTSAGLYAARNDDITSTSGLVSYWKLNNNYTDSKGSNNLTGQGSPTFSTDVPFANYPSLAQAGFLLNFV